MTRADRLPLGHQVQAGLGRSTVLADIDYETYSEAGYLWNDGTQKWGKLAGATKTGLAAVGAAVYAEHPSTEVISCYYNLKDGQGERYWEPGMPPPIDLFIYVLSGSLLEAWNAPFERWITLKVCAEKYGWPLFPDSCWRDAMAKSRHFAMPGKLAEAGKVMGLGEQKSKEGDSLIKKFSLPRNPTKTNPARRNLMADYPDDANRFRAYNAQDIVAEAEASLRLPDQEGEELEFWQADLAINSRGVYVDRPSIEACCKIVDDAIAKYNAELYALTGGTVSAASEIAKLTGWLGGMGVHTNSLDEEHVTDLLKERARWPAAAVRALEIRQAVGSASVKKVYAMRNRICNDGRVKDLFVYHTARTGRVGGEGPQPTNLPRAGGSIVKCGCGRYHGAMLAGCPWCGLPVPPGKKKAEWGIEAAEDALAVIAHASLDLLERYFGEALPTIAGVLRSLYTSAPAHDMISSDYSAIEGVVTAALAGEEWRLEVFRTHGKIYEMSAAKITGIPFEEFMAHAGYTDLTKPQWWLDEQTGKHHPMRQTIGKVSELASGFGGWIGAWKNFGADAFMSDEEIKRGILDWRRESPNIEYFWGGQRLRQGYGRDVPFLFGLEGMAVLATMTPGQWFPVMRKDGTHTGVSYLCWNDILFCHLPSGRSLHYHRPRLTPNPPEQSWRGQWSLSFEGWNSNAVKAPPGWIRMQLYGGLLCENVVQAVARDIQRHGMVNLERAGYPIVLHVYDEDVSEVPEGFGSIEEYERIMSTMPPWATGWPIRAAGGWRGKRYRKG